MKTPEIGLGSRSCIEDLFDPKLLKRTLDGKSFELSEEDKEKDNYSKTVFAEKVVKPNARTIDFSNFTLLLDRIVAVLQDYEQRRPALATA